MERRLFASATGVAVTASLLAAPSAAAAKPNPFAGVRAKQVTLVTGDVVTLSGKGLSVRHGPGRSGITFHKLQYSGRAMVIPSDALPLLGQGRLDQRLFDVTQLIKWGYDDAARKDLPLIVEGGPGARATAVDGLRVTRSLPTLGVDAASVPFWTPAMTGSTQI